MNPESFVDLMALRPAGEDRFEAPIAPEQDGTMFGGQFLAQGLIATQATVAGRHPHSLHAYFIRPGSIEIPTEYVVERVRDGRSFNSRSVSAWQNGKELFRMMVSFHIDEPGKEYASAKMPDVPAPEAVTFRYSDFILESNRNDEFVGQREVFRPWDILYVDPPTAPRGEPVTVDQRMWMRIKDSIADHPELYHAALVYLSDATLIDHVVLPHGLRWVSDDIDGTSLDHAMWFHKVVSPEQWLLFDQHVESTSGARGLASARFFTESGDLVATCVQEGLMRINNQ